jgi:hypothetical protein
VVVFQAMDYSSIFDVNYLSTHFQSAASAGNTVVLSTVMTGIAQITFDLTIVVTRTAPPACFTWGDPHLNTQDGLFFNFQNNGAASSLAVLPRTVTSYFVRPLQTRGDSRLMVACSIGIRRCLLSRPVCFR